MRSSCAVESTGAWVYGCAGASSSISRTTLRVPPHTKTSHHRHTAGGQARHKRGGYNNQAIHNHLGMFRMYCGCAAVNGSVLSLHHGGTYPLDDMLCVCVSVKWCRSIGAKRESFVGEIETAEKVKNIQIQLARITAFTNHPNSLSSAVYTAATTDERETKHYTRYMSRHIIFWSSYHLQKHLITLRRADRVRPLLPLCSPIRDNDSIL